MKMATKTAMETDTNISSRLLLGKSGEHIQGLASAPAFMVPLERVPLETFFLNFEIAPPEVRLELVPRRYSASSSQTSRKEKCRSDVCIPGAPSPEPP